MAEPASMAGRALGAGLWTVGTRLATKLIDLVMLVTLARFLGPAEFGLVAMAMAAVFIVEALFELPMAAALIRAPALTPDMLHTAFTLSLLRGLVIALLLLALAWPLAAFNDEPRLRALLAVLALAPALRGLVSPRMVEYARVFNFRPDARMELSGKAVALVLSIGIAATTGSYWAIAAATVGGPLTTTVMSYVIAPLRPRLTLSRWPYFSDLIGWNFLSQAGAALNWQIDRLILPRLTTTAMFGQYAMGKQISEIPMQALIQPLFRPAMSAMVAADADRRSRYVQLSNAIGLVMVGVMGVPMLWPDILVRVALGPSWEPAAQWLRWISAVAVLGLPAILMGPLAMTLDRTRWVAARTLVELVIRLPLVWWGAVRFGIPGAIAGSAIATAAGTFTGMCIVRRLVDVGLVPQAMALVRPMCVLLAAGAVLYLGAPWVLAAATLPALLGRAVPLGGAYLLAYLFFAWLAWRLAGRPAGLERHALDRLARRLRPRRPGAP
ncbi:oligosaccharide flippase family protein (plasmid) [Comamonadaceae bacterium OTU4NAUVB1]|nr:oligosaccharide flippase family protein [Comamonadaceae bacterium OTU4NAUVB1]